MQHEFFLSLPFLLALFNLALCASTLNSHLSPTWHRSPDHKTASSSARGRRVSIPLFASLEEFSRIVDISYCVGTTGIQQPFTCASRCDEFPNFELVAEFNTGPLMSDSCGYIALDHGSADGRNKRFGRIIVAFRGTYSIANTIVDLSTVPQEYVPYPDSHPNETTSRGSTSFQLFLDRWSPFRALFPVLRAQHTTRQKSGHIKCTNCTVHSGFWQSWQNTRSIVLPHLNAVRIRHPDYSFHLVGHSLGGAVAALAGLELDALGWKPTITTFGEPKIGNIGLRRFIDLRFALQHDYADVGYDGNATRYRRVTHVDDPVPLLPLQEWGYKPHAGEVFISKSSLQPSLLDLEHCQGDEDKLCIAGAESAETKLSTAIAEILQTTANSLSEQHHTAVDEESELELELRKRWGIPIPSRYKMWQLFFAHRDYFWRLGLCVRGGDPSDWGREKYRFPVSGRYEAEIPQ